MRTDEVVVAVTGLLPRDEGVAEVHGTQKPGNNQVQPMAITHRLDQRSCKENELPKSELCKKSVARPHRMRSIRSRMTASSA